MTSDKHVDELVVNDDYAPPLSLYIFWAVSVLASAGISGYLIWRAWP